ncbi:restriction endonuclease subunit S [Pseudodesulfovibrio indicus]|uniref:Type I restriction enzyme S subunit n=1 Tax=Pseudodesulfovibrio indicus TaxID=1716143 RepID=A0A126QNN2_9BACT|nr:restriction endonuclease subunit S [Pseudodesulfovibrio indicus]AMK11346.1 hypothetical protein AWY79_09575 [Pseudodesulfovibrio indicus]TDT89733.1 type I restriction enzyme S subunit [Pseudodesulfovibrio indicus]
MMQLPRYESYKDSGVEWLGEIPEEWDVERNLGIFDERKMVNHPDKELLSVTIERGVIKQTEITTKKDSSNEDKSKYKLLKPGYLAYNKMRMWQGAVGMSEYEGIVSPAYIVLSPRDKAYSRFFHYLLRSDQFLIESNRLSYGLCDDMNSLRYEDFKGIYTPLPPKNTMERIVSFLDQKTAEIDEAIAKKQKLIELLQEQKSILINQAVTKGLSPDAPMKDSGVEWIGEIPAHWEVKRLKHISSFQSGITLGKSYSGNNQRDYPYLRVANVQYGYFDLEDVAELRLPPAIAESYKLRPNDILVTEGGDIDKLGRGTVWKGEIEECLHQNHIFAVRVNNVYALEEYVSTVMESDCGRHYFTWTANKTTNLASTNKSKLGDFKLPLPSKTEQAQIATHVEATKTEINGLISSVEKEIKTLDEYKKTTISSAVTGKIKV